MHIFLYGPPGSGKSTLGKLLAHHLELTFVDLDTEIEQGSGQPVSEIIGKGGESVFRDIETATLRTALSSPEAVVALGGGALLRPENRALAESAGLVVVLEAGLSVLLERLSLDSDKRPLLVGDMKEKLSALLEDRREHYGSFSIRVDASDLPEVIVWDIQRALGRHRLRGMGAGYDVIAQNGGLDQLGTLLKSRNLGGPILIVSDTNVAPLYGDCVLKSLEVAGYQVQQVIIPAGEKHKNLETVTTLWRSALQAGLDRKSTILALGGGVVGDLAGFVAASFMRGCNWVVVPTTLLAMVDASMGGKTGFDLPEGKNLVGAFYPPKLVLADPDVLVSLPDREFRAGLAEVVKHAVIADPALFDLCAEGPEIIRMHPAEIVRRAMAVKVRIIEEDPFEQGIRATLNYGHTIGHALELVSRFDLLHGEAVSMGMVAEARLAERLGLAERGLADIVSNSLVGLGLPVEIPKDFDSKELINAMKLDKKRASGVVHFALPIKIGEVRAGIEIKNLEVIL